jgi:hypothetical protein
MFTFSGAFCLVRQFLQEFFLGLSRFHQDFSTVFLLIGSPGGLYYLHSLSSVDSPVDLLEAINRIYQELSFTLSGITTSSLRRSAVSSRAVYGAQQYHQELYTALSSITRSCIQRSAVSPGAVYSAQ